jgi:hypothetical protein
MKLYTYYSESHQVLFERYFRPSLPDGDDLELEVTQIRQFGDGNYMTEGWRQTMREKVGVILNALDRDPCFIWDDCDVQFFGPIVDVLTAELGEYELACQNDSGGMLCAGFFICKSTENTKRMFHTIFEEMTADTSEVDDQQRLNRHAHACRCTFLSQRFWTVGLQLNGVGRPLTRWQGQDVAVPKGILMHHANWTVGVDNKIKLLELVRDKVPRQRQGVAAAAAGESSWKTHA